MFRNTFLRFLRGCSIGVFIAAQIFCQSGIPCPARIDHFSGAKRVIELPRGEASEIVRALSPEISRFYRIGGGDARNLRPERLERLLQFTPVPGGRTGERLMVVRLVDDSCGAHFNCVAYVIAVSPAGAKSILIGRESLGESAGGAADLGIIRRSGSAYPDLLFISHASAYEAPISCFIWKVNHYTYVPCAPECAHFLDQPRTP